MEAGVICEVIVLTEGVEVVLCVAVCIRQNCVVR